MPFLDHLEELRWRLLKSLVAILVGTIVGWVIVQRIDIIGLLTQPIAPHLQGGRLNYTSPTDPFFITLKFAFIVGVVLSSPVVVFQLWAFLAPALYEREKRLVVPALVVGVLLFLAGAAAGYFLALPHALSFLLGFQNQALQPIITADRYFAFAAQVIVAMGAVTELPLVIIILTSLGLVTPAGLRRNRRIALLGAAILAAFLAPPDALSMVVGIAVLLLFYEVGILCAIVVSRRRSAAAARAGAAVAVALLCWAGLPHSAAAQRPVLRPPPRRLPVQPGDTTRRADSVSGHLIDTATARKLGLPTGPTRTFPSPDAVLDTLLKLKSYRVTQYLADTLRVLGDSGTIILTGETLLDREGTKLEADTVHYRQSSCRLDASGSPRLFDQGSQSSAPTVVVGEGMRYDTCLKRGTVLQGLTTFQQGGANWFMRANIALDSGSTRLYGARSNITSDERPVPGYHFAAGEMKWLNKTVMIARPTVLYVRDVPILWLPFIFNDIRPGRHSGMLVPRFGLNDLVRPTRNYQRHVTNIGYYLVLNDYVDLLTSADWYSGRSFGINGQLHYRWLDQFVNGYLAVSRLSQLDAGAHSTMLTWTHSQSFSSRTHFSASVNYATQGTVVQRNSVDPYLTLANLASNVNFEKRFDWGSLNIGGSRSQDLAGINPTQQNFPNVSITPAPIDLASWITWSPGFTFSNSQTFRSQATSLVLVPNGIGGIDTLKPRFDTRMSLLAINTPLRLGRWNWTNAVQIQDQTSNQRTEFVIPDPADSTLLHHVVYDRTFSTKVDWSTGIGLPQLLPGTWHIQPGIGIGNKTSAGPYMLRNQFTGGRFLQQGKRLQFSLGAAPTFFGFFPGIGPFSRIRHSVAFVMNYQYAPGAKVDPAFAHALDPAGRLLNARSDPQQTITLGLSQVFEAKFKPSARDTGNTPPRKIRLLSLNTSGISYNFEQAKMPGRVGWQTQTLTNTFSSDLLPGFNLQVTHDLWKGQVGLDTTKFDPFLQSLSASFALSPRTFAALGALIGLGHRPEPATGGTPGAAPGAVPGGTFGPGPRSMGGFGGFGGPAGGFAGGGGRGFSLNVQFSLQRTRKQTRTDSLGNAIPIPGLSGGNQQMSLAMAFSPTPHWTASWNTNYDFETKRFPQHFVRLERDLHRWHASFAFSRTASGNFAFNFYVALLDEPDIKFDYDQQSYLHTANPNP